MRCSSCGLPLSPSRTHCPRCGTAIPGAARKTKGEHEAYTPLSPSPEWHAERTMASSFPLQDVAQQGWSQPQVSSIPSGAYPQGASHFSTAPASSSQRRKRTTRIGFALATICIITGAFLLVFISILAQNLPSSNTPPVQVNSASSTRLTTTATPTLSATVTSTPTTTATATATPTPQISGSQYIDNALMATTVNEGNGQVIEAGSNFTLNQKIYVAFSVHTGPQPGAVCLSWYLNNTHMGDYSLGLGANKQYSAYTYFWLKNSGPGYVDVSWASSQACTDKQLAQHLTFAIN